MEQHDSINKYVEQYDIINKCVEQCQQWCAEDSEGDFYALDLFDYMNDLMLAQIRTRLAGCSLSVEDKMEYYAGVVNTVRECFDQDYIEECIPISITREVHDVPWEMGSASGIHHEGIEYHGVWEAVEKCYDLLSQHYKEVIEEMETF